MGLIKTWIGNQTLIIPHTVDRPSKATTALYDFYMLTLLADRERPNMGSSRTHNPRKDRRRCSGYCSDFAPP